MELELAKILAGAALNRWAGGKDPQFAADIEENEEGDYEEIMATIKDHNDLIIEVEDEIFDAVVEIVRRKMGAESK